jgi:hypothetical protein
MDAFFKSGTADHIVAFNDDSDLQYIDIPDILDA